jgi:hypothetical protein
VPFGRRGTCTVCRNDLRDCVVEQDGTRRGREVAHRATDRLVLGHTSAPESAPTQDRSAGAATNPRRGKIRTHHCRGPGATPTGIPAVFAVCSAI